MLVSHCRSRVLAAYSYMARCCGIAVAVLLPLYLAACSVQPTRQLPLRNPAVVRAHIVQLIPTGTHDRAGWATDIYAAFAAQQIDPNTRNLCSVLAVAEQESGLQVDPVIPGLPRIARKEIDRRAAARHIPGFVVDAALWLKSPDGRRYSERLKSAHTEGQLSRMFQDFIGMVPLGKHLFGDLNPVRTGGPMQVSVSFAEAHDAGYPYPVKGSIRDEVFSRRGGIYFGVLHLLGYSTHYTEPLYRFADFNAGWYASRNAAFQHAVSVASGIPLARDGDLVRYGSSTPGSTELAMRSLGKRLHLGDSEIHRALEQGETLDFERTDVYARVFALADRLSGKRLPREQLPGITLESPKITRRLTTAWFARRVDARRQQCLRRAGAG